MDDRFSKFLLVPVLLLALFFSCRVAAKAMPGDAILGMWEVKNEYYTAVYEIIRDQNQYFGKVHYYNDGDTVIIARKNKNDYMLEGIYYKDSTYTKGVLHGPKEKYAVSLVLLGDTLTVKMKVQGYPYTEYWTKKKKP